MIIIGRIGRKDTIVLLTIGIERIYLISKNFIYANRIKLILYNISIENKMVTKAFRLISAAYITLSIQLGDASSINTGFDVASL